jgi:hypothetical protein
LKIVATIDGVYLRAAPRSGAPAQLLGQRAGIGEVLTGRVEQYRLRAEALERVQDSALPRGVGIFGLALAPVDGPIEFYSLNNDGYISGLTPKGASAWRSARPYGGYPPLLTALELFGTVNPADEDFDQKARAFQGRLLAEQNPGGVRLMVPQNLGDSAVTLSRQRIRGEGEVVILAGPPSPSSPQPRLRRVRGGSGARGHRWRREHGDSLRRQPQRRGPEGGAGEARRLAPGRRSREGKITP